MKKIYNYLQLGLWLIIALAIPHLGFAQTCDVTPMNISKIATDWTTNCARVATDACDPTNGPLCDGTPSSNWLLLNPNDYCLPKAPCNAVGFSKVEVTMTMEGTWRVKNIGNLSQNTSIGLLGCVKAWMCDLLFDPLEPSAFTGIITLAAGEEKNGLLPTRTKTSAYPGDLDALFAKNCSDKVCIEGLADGFTTLTISNGNLQAITTVFASLKACVNYKKFDWSVTGSEAACETSADGKVFVSFTPAPGTVASDYEIRVGNGGTWTVSQAAVSGANTISGLPAGSYTVAVVYKPLANSVIPSNDATCGYCKASVTIGSATATLSCSSDPDCPGGSADGSVTVGVTGNNLGTISYNWGGGNTSATLSNLLPGNYTVTVTYGPNGKCSKTTTCTVLAAPGVDFDVSSTNIVCFGANNGTITVDPTTGTPNFTVGVTGQTNKTSNGAPVSFSNLAPGPYTITVTDANGCVTTKMVTLTEPNPVTITCASVNTSCKGLSDGKIRVTSVTSDVGGPYKVSVDQIAGGNNDIAESVQAIPYEATVGTGTYVITVKDKNDCIARCTTIVKDGFTPAINCVRTQIACFGGKGTITATASGTDADGNPVASTFDYVLSGSASANNTTGIFTGLSAGTYTVTATKTGNVGCSVVCTGNIIVEPPQLSCTITGNNSVCRNEKITFTGPAGMTNYVWTVTGATFTGQGTVSIEVTAPASGSFEVKLKTQKTSTVDNTTLCESGECTKTVNVTVPTCPVIAPKTVCAGTQNVEYDAGSGYTNIVWSTSDPKISIASGQGTHKVKFNVATTAVGPYTITFTAKQNGCPVTCTYTLTVDPLPTLVLTPEQPICRNPPTGKITAVASGGTAPYVFIIRKDGPMGTIITPTITNQTANSLTYNGLAEGSYYVEVIDKNGTGCSSDPGVQILAAANPLDFTLTLDCANQVSGNVAVNLTNITGGAAAPNGYEYQVDGTAGTWIALVNPIFLPVNSGNYTIYLREKGVATGCDPYGKVINTTCCKLDGVCKLTTPAPITGCNLNGVPAAKTNPTDVFSGVTFCTEARIKVTTTDGGSLCGGGLTRTYTYVLYDDVIDNNIFDTGEPFIAGTCAETYTVTPPPVVINCPANNLTIPACTDNAAAQTLLDNYKAQFSFTGGCNAVPSFSAVVLPNPCTGGTVSLTYTVTSDCDTKSCTKSIIRTVNPSITLNCADNVNITTCKTQTEINDQFEDWLGDFSVTGGCNATGRFDGEPKAPLACGGTTTVTYRVVDPFGCNTQTCTKTFTVTPPALVINCPANNLTIPACTSADAAQTLLNNYKAQFSFTGGCNAVPSFSAVVLPNPCTGGTVSITYTVTSDCDTKTCTKSIIRTVNPSITLNCADNVNITTCKTQTEINDQFEDWLGDFSVTGGCNATGRFDGEPKAPLACGGTTTVTYRVVDPFGCNTQTCTKTFTVTPPALVINCPANNLTIPACTSADAAQTLLNNYKAQFSFTGGCNAVPSFSAVVLPNPCTGGTVSITYTVTSDCDTKTCTKSIIRTVNPSITLNCADNVNITTCKTQTEINDQFEDWLGDFSVTGGCNATGRFDGEPKAPLACGGTTTVTYRVVDPFGCNTQTCTKTFTVTPPALVITCPESNLTIPACTSADAAQTLLNNYKAQFSFSGGCNAVPSFSAVVLPNPCTGGTVSITYTVTSDCDTKTCTKSIIRTVNPSITLNCADNVNITTCKTQDQVNTEFDNWLSQFSVTGGCNATGRFDGEPKAPLACGGTTTVTYRVVDAFGCNTQTCTKTFTITPPDFNLSVPETGLNIPACTSNADAQTLLNNYKALFSFSGGCNSAANFSPITLPDYCTGGSVTLTYSFTSDCGTRTITRTITRAAEPTLSISCPETDLVIPACLTEVEAQKYVDDYKKLFSYSGGCNPKITFSVVTLPNVCTGGEITITYTVTSDCAQKTCTKKITRIANPIPTVNISVDKSKFCEVGDAKVVISIPGNKVSYDIYYNDVITKVNENCNPVGIGGTYIVEDDLDGEFVLDLKQLTAGTYQYTVEKVVDPFGCSSVPDVSDLVSITVYPKPVGESRTKTINNCNKVNVDLQSQIKCNVLSTFKWYSVQSVGSSIPYNNPNVDGETVNPSGTGQVINDILSNLTKVNQTIIYRVVPTSVTGVCEGEPFFITVTIRPATKVECLACMTEVNVSLDANCRFEVLPNHVIDFERCENGRVLRDALEVVISGTNASNIIPCAGTYTYVVKLKEEYEKCFLFDPCWGKITAEDKTAPALVCAPADITLDCYDVNYVLNNRLTIGNVGATSSPRPAATGSQTINNAEGVAGTGDNCQLGLAPPALVSDVIKNLGYAYFKDNCYNCGCRITLKWSDKVVFFSCEDMKINGGIYATISREWVATDCNGMSTAYVQKIHFTRPEIDDFVFNGPSEGKYDRVVTYNACTPDKSLIKKEDVTPYVCSYFNTTANPRCLFIDQVECNYSVSIKDTEFPICNGKGLKIDREIYVFDWCAGGIVDTFHVLIKIGDFEAPTYDYAHGAPFDISTGPMDCTAAIPVTVAGIKSAFGVTIKDNCTLGNVSVSVYTKDRYVKGILVYQGPADPLCDDDRARVGELRGDNDAYRLGSCDKEYICWEKVEYAVMNGMMVGLPVGKHLMVIDAFDGCYNASTACFVFEVKDKIAPIMKCDDDLHVTLSNANGYTNGYAQVSAEDIDEGSWDNCKLAWIAVRRNVPDGCAASFIAKGYDTNGNGKLDALPADGDVSKADGFDLNGDGDIADFGETFILKGGKLMTPLLDYVEFFCCDLTERVTVELWGGDIYGNTNYCWMDLLIEDKVAPTCLAPWDVTIYCDDKNIAQIDNKIASAKIFGDVTIPSGNDCAALDTVYSTEKKLKCGYGYIDRIWTLTKQTVKGPISVTCKQRIHILPVHEYNICFPKDVSTDCKTPIIDTVITDELGCDILAVNVHDKRYDASDDECYKIFRTYSVINWCTYDDRCGDPLEQTNISIIDRAVFGNYGKAPIYVLVRDREGNKRDGVEEFYISKDLIHNNADDIRFKPAYCEVAGEFYHSFIYTQIIKVYDDTRPVVTGTRDTFCTSPTACTANITKVVTLKDNCTDKVELETQFLMIAPFQTLEAGKMILYSTPRWSTKDLGNGQFEIKVSNLPEGTHDLIVVGRDECGNLSLPTRIPFVVKDCKAPAPICINGLSTELMPDGNNGGMMAVWASDFVASKIYDCNGQGPETQNGLKLVTKYSINRVGSPVVSTQTGLNLTCADAGKVILVELHAWDNAGNHDFCVTFVEVQDNRKVCPDPGNVVTGEISGLVATDEAEPVSGVKIDVSGGAQLNQNTAGNGLFNFGKLPVGSDFTLAAQLDKDHLNGVSTFDLVQLQKHILGVQTINNPYRLIAGDVNNSKSISTLDMIQIRKLILNIDERFSNVPSWRFVDAAYKFPDPNNPWVEAFPEVVNVNDLAGKVQANFIAIKMGDLNGNAQVSSTASAEVRSAKALQLQTEEQELKAGQRYAVSIRAKDLASVQGFQFTLQVDPTLAQLEQIEYNGVMKADHFGYFPRSGQITSSYVGAPLVGAPLSSATAESVLFTLHLKAEANLPLSKVLKINSQLTPKEAYDKDDELMDVQLELKGATLSDLAALHQNTPNPFVEETAIGFYLPKASAATLTVRDVKGALLYRLEGNYAKGDNQVILKHEQLRSSGVLYYTLETADFTATKKMILLNK